MATIVTAFMTNINVNKSRSYDKYLIYGKKILTQPIPIVCFLEQQIFDDYFADSIDLYPYTQFCIFERQDNYLMKYEDQMKNFHVFSDNPDKDTPAYMFTQCHKTEWVKMAIEINPFKTTDFVWVDFGIYHMIQNDMEFALYLEQLVRKKYDFVRIASCVDLESECKVDIYRQITWYFAGSIFGGSGDRLIEFANVMKSNCLDIIGNQNHLMWEINIWYLIYKQYPQLFCPYHSNHDVSILKNY